MGFREPGYSAAAGDLSSPAVVFTPGEETPDVAGRPCRSGNTRAREQRRRGRAPPPCHRRSLTAPVRPARQIYAVSLPAFPSKVSCSLVRSLSTGAARNALAVPALCGWNPRSPGLFRGWLGLCRCYPVVRRGWRAHLTQWPASEQGAADDRAAGEDAGSPPERGVIAVCQCQPGQGRAADQPGRGEVRGEVGGDGGGEDGVQQRGADGGAELLADGDGGGGDAGVLRGPRRTCRC